MKSSVVTALIIVGVLGTSTAAMAMNTDTLSGIDAGTIGKAIEVLVPVVSDTVPLTPNSGAPRSTMSPNSSASPVAPGNVTSAPTSAPVATGGGDPHSSQDSNSTSKSDPAPSNSPEPSESKSEHDD
ncbi:hypothetical protein [Alpinimonas psychrophila]|uniref:Cell division septation protein DedD n=1 Tax=Alpinimonas psychrophila TaxID=748908 RepID=A0A7W3JUD5_9MICO|nr:hypothetical protein [Alpinimonas psychrophila]MBA8829360.1 cell division septation protein DedD [Alpinimonas psychrophila]